MIGAVLSDMDCVEVSSLLDSRYDIATRAGLHCSPMAHRTLGTVTKGMLRLSVGYFNTKEDIDAAAAAIEEVLSNK